MKEKRVNQLISKYYNGETSLNEERELRDFFNSGPVPDEFQADAEQFRYYDRIGNTDTSDDIDPLEKIDFSEQDVNVQAAEMTSVKSRVIIDPESQFSPTWSLRIAAGIVLLLIGFAAGQFFDGDDYKSPRAEGSMNAEVQQMRDVLMGAGTFQHASAGERLAVVNEFAEMPADDKEFGRDVTEILIFTMNNDKSVNVRMAAAEALFRFSEEPLVRHALIASLGRQDEPLMQITLIDMLVELKAQNAVQQMEKMLVNTDTRDVVRNRLEAGIGELKI